MALNTFKTWMLMAALSALIVWAGGLMGGRQGAVIALAIAFFMNAFSYFFSDHLALSMAGAVPADAAVHKRLLDQVRLLVRKAGLPMPRVYIAPSQQPNAFAAGRSPQHAVIVVNEGLLALLDDREVAGVLAHELAHIRHRDILIATVAATMAGAITWLAQALQWGLMWGGGGEQNDRRDSHWIADVALMVLAPLAAALIQLAISRSREYAADAGAARLTGDPEGLASALTALERRPYSAPYDQVRDSSVAAAMAHLYIVNPLRGQSLVALFSTHPPIEERVRRLRQMRVS